MPVLVSITFLWYNEDIQIHGVLIMNIIEYGKENTDVMIFLHGGGLSWWNYQEAAELLADRFHIVIPILNGHSGSDTCFTTIEEQVERLINYIQNTHGGRVLLIGGVSLGSQVLLEILSRKRDVCQFAVIESASVIPLKRSIPLMKSLISLSYPLIKRKWFSKLQFRSLHIKEEYFDRYYSDTRKLRKEDLCAFLAENSTYSIKDTLSQCKANVLVIVGGKEQSRIKQSAKMIASALSNSEIVVTKKLFHGELSINYARKYAEMLLEFMSI